MILVSLHLMAAKAFDMDALALDPEEANRVALALAKVGEHYHFEASAEALMWTNLAAVLASVYGSRAMMVWHRAQTQKKAKHRVVSTQAPAPVHSADQAAKAAATPAPTLHPDKLDPHLYAHASTAG